jgi:hypothetical protein
MAGMGTACHGGGVQPLRSPDRKDWERMSAGTGAGGWEGEGEGRADMVEQRFSRSISTVQYSTVQ